MPTTSNGFSRGKCSCGNESRFLYLSIDNESPASFACMEDSKRASSTHQYKCTDEEDLSLQALDEEKSNAAGPEDLFLLYSTGDVACDVSSLRNVVVIDRSCWQAYYGPFAARAFFIQTNRATCLNTSPVELLSLVQGVNSAHSEILVGKRPFSSYTDAHERTGPVSVLERFWRRNGVS
uniref:Uncharacterized protein n=1 Tax=Globisporangium ultimum (strain ATCC 200006 / CBS 805.95 / DAOM BR144) TaxID=431595 RepID=K3WPP2_GLOUD